MCVLHHRARANILRLPVETHQPLALQRVLCTELSRERCVYLKKNAKAGKRSPQAVWCQRHNQHHCLSNATESSRGLKKTPLKKRTLVRCAVGLPRAVIQGRTKIKRSFRRPQRSCPLPRRPPGSQPLLAVYPEKIAPAGTSKTERRKDRQVSVENDTKRWN